MRRWRVLAVAAVVAIPLAGCSNIKALNSYAAYPDAVHMPSATQLKFQSASHWDLLAQNEARTLAAALPEQAVITVPAELANSPFTQSYRNMLIQHLLDLDIVVSDVAGAARQSVDFEVQVVRHRDRDAQRWPSGTFTALTASGAWLVVAADRGVSGGLALLPFALAADAYLENNRNASTPDTEVVITTRVRDGNYLRGSNTNVYYFNAGDTGLYQADEPAPVLTVTDQA